MMAFEKRGVKINVSVYISKFLSTIPLCLRFIAVISDRGKQKTNWFENFQTKEKFEPQQNKYNH